jgi:hypothetical protein
VRDQPILMRINTAMLGFQQINQQPRTRKKSSKHLSKGSGQSLMDLGNGCKKQKQVIESHSKIPFKKWHRKELLFEQY